MQMGSLGLLAGEAAAAEMLLPQTLPFTAEAVPSLPAGHGVHAMAAEA